MSEILEPQTNPTRRRFLLASGAVSALALAGCTTSDSGPVAPQESTQSAELPYMMMYRAMPEEDFPIPAVDLRRVPPRF